MHHPYYEPQDNPVRNLQEICEKYVRKLGHKADEEAVYTLESLIDEAMVHCKYLGVL